MCCVSGVVSRDRRPGGADRVTLIRLNVLRAVFALWRFGVGIFILVLFLSTSDIDRIFDALTKYTT